MTASRPPRQPGSTPGDDPVIEMPLTQVEIGDLIGLTNVSVSKTLCQLSEEGLIERRGRVIVLRGVDQSQEMVGYSGMEVAQTSASGTSAIGALNDAVTPALPRGNPDPHNARNGADRKGA